MSRSLRISRAHKHDYDDIEDVNALLTDLEEKAVEDVHLDSVPEETPVDMVFEDDEHASKPSKAPRKTIPVKVSAKGKRTIHIQELDPNIIPPNLEEFMDPGHTGSKLAVIGKPGCFAKGTRVRMFNGTVKNIEDISVGEQVMGDDSTPRNVIELCRGRDTMYRIQPNKGKSVVVNSKHILSLMSSGTARHKKGEILDIELDKYLNYPNKGRYKWFKTEVIYPEQSIELDPYILGYWLGDGTSSKPTITTIEKEVIDYFATYYSNHPYNKFCKASNPYEYGIFGRVHCKGGNPFLNSLRTYNILNNKHIPHAYKVNSRKHRLALLAGLLDSDGSLDMNGTCYEITFKNEQLLDDTVELARSLGFSASKIPRIGKCYNSKNPDHSDTYYRCRIVGEHLTDIPCVVPRKRAVSRRQIKNPLVSGFTTTKLEEDDYYGFILDGNHRFLLDDFSVVHNTGKSSLIRSLLYEKSEIFPCGQVYSGTEDSNHAYGKFLPSTFIHNSFNQSAYMDFIRRQKIAKQYLDNPWAVCVWDDITEDERIFNLPLVKGTYKNGRHWKMLHLLSLQYALDIKPVIRTNIDGAFLLRETNKRNRKVLFENYASAIDDYSDFCSIFDQVTNDYVSLYIHNRVQSNSFEDCVFWYKARDDIPQDFTFGCKEFWWFHEERYNPLYVDPITV